MMVGRRDSLVWVLGAGILVSVHGHEAHGAPPPRRGNGHVPGSLVDLLDDDDWGVAQGNAAESRPGEQPGDGGATGPAGRPVVVEQPVRPDPNVPLELQRLIADRNELVEGCNFFGLVEQTLKAEQAFAAANGKVQRLNAAANAAAQAVHMASAQKNGGLVAQAQAQLREARAAAGEAGREFAESRAKVAELYQKLFPKIEELLRLYHQMRRHIFHDRADPNMPAVHKTLTQAVRQRKDFHEGKILAAICEIYVGDASAAGRHLEGAAFFAAENFFAWPFANDMCLAYLLLGQPDHIDKWVLWVKNVDEKRRTSVRCWLVGLQGAIECKDNAAKEWFARCERKLSSAAKKGGVPVVLPPEFVGDWALFLLTCPNETLRDPEKAKQLLADVPVESGGL